MVKSRARRELESSLPVGERTTRVGLALLGTPYKNYTLELDDRIETPSVNMAGMDCWTFFEIALGTARALKTPEDPTTQDLLRMIELDRYRGGTCNGIFTSRLHYLEQWLYDNQKRGLVTNVTPSLPGARRLKRDMKEMSAFWHSSRQLRANPSLVPEMSRIENQLSRRGIWYVPKSKVAGCGKISPQRRYRLHRNYLAKGIHVARWACLPGSERRLTVSCTLPRTRAKSSLILA